MKTGTLTSALGSLYAMRREIHYEQGYLGDDSGTLTPEEEETALMLARAETATRAIIRDLEDFQDEFEEKLEELG